MTFTLEELRVCAEREVKQRQRVYARLVEKGSMTPVKAEREIAMMQAIVEILKPLEQPELPLGPNL